MSRLNLAVLAVLLLSATGRADIAQPGYKFVRSYARFDNLADYPDYVFFAAHHPKHDRRGGPEKKEGVYQVSATQLDPGNAEIVLGGNPIMGGRYLLAVPKALVEKSGGSVMSNWFDGATPGVVQTAIPAGYRTVSETDKRNDFRTVYKVAFADDTSQKEKTLRLEVLSADKPGQGGVKDGESATDLPPGTSTRWYLIGGFGGAAVLLLVGWLVLRRRDPNDL